MSEQKKPAWVTKGKTIRQLIEELQSFENQELEVRISIDAGDTHQPISLVRKQRDYCVLTSYVDFYDKKPS
jgi:hypothetical protein